MKTIDGEVLAAYNAGIEKDRLRKDLGLIEFERTKEILQEKLPPAPATICDIGGGYGEYSYWLASLGYDVYLYDISKKNIELAHALSSQHNVKLKAIEVSDARSINLPDHFADTILLFGPLYHIVDYNERILALKESYRLLKPNGLLFTAAITRYATALHAITVYGLEDQLLDEPAFCEMIKTDITTGHHIKHPQSAYCGMGRSYFHLPDELKDEIEAAGFIHTDVRGIIGPGWLVPNLNEVWKDEIKRESVMRIVRMFEKETAIMGLSTHLLTVSEKENNLIK